MSDRPELVQADGHANIRQRCASNQIHSTVYTANTVWSAIQSAVTRSKSKLLTWVSRKNFRSETTRNSWMKKYTSQSLKFAENKTVVVDINFFLFSLKRSFVLEYWHVGLYCNVLWYISWTNNTVLKASCVSKLEFYNVWWEISFSNKIFGQFWIGSANICANPFRNTFLKNNDLKV